MLSKISLTSVFLAFLVLMAIIFQADLLPYLSIGQAVLNLILIILTLLVFKKKNITAVYLAIFGGIILDINFGIGFGPYLISYLVALGLVYLLQNFVLKEETIVFYIIAVLLVSFVFDLCLIGIINAIGYGVSLIQFWPVILKDIAYNVSFSVILFGIYDYYSKRYFPSSEIKLSDKL